MKGRIMLFVASILTYQFSPAHLTPSAANQVGVASVYSHESGSGTASGQKLNREAFTAAHRTLPFGSKVKVTTRAMDARWLSPSTIVVRSCVVALST